MISRIFRLFWWARKRFHVEAINNLKKEFNIHPSIEIGFPVTWVGTIDVGQNTYVMPYCELVAGPNSKIINGQGCAIARNVTIRSWTHKTGLPLHRTENTYVRDIVIGNNCWLGTNSYIKEGVHLGDNCIVAANCVVTKSFESGSIIAGIPGRKIGENSTEDGK